jgi:molybdopterin-binding protein
MSASSPREARHVAKTRGIDGGTVAAITRDSAERLALETGAPVTVIIKATDVIIGTSS